MKIIEGALAACAALFFAASPAAGLPLTAQVLDKIDVPSASPDGGEISELSGLAWDEDGNQSGYTAESRSSKPPKGGNKPKPGLWDPTRTMTWDEDDRLKLVEQSGKGLTETYQAYLYDDSGARTHKRTGEPVSTCPRETKYVSQYFVVQDEAVWSKHIYAGSERVATAVVDDISTCARIRVSAPICHTASGPITRL